MALIYDSTITPFALGTGATQIHDLGGGFATVVGSTLLLTPDAIDGSQFLRDAAVIGNVTNAQTRGIVTIPANAFTGASNLGMVLRVASGDLYMCALVPGSNAAAIYKLTGAPSSGVIIVLPDQLPSLVTNAFPLLSNYNATHSYSIEAWVQGTTNNKVAMVVRDVTAGTVVARGTRFDTSPPAALQGAGLMGLTAWGTFPCSVSITSLYFESVAAAPTKGLTTYGNSIVLGFQGSSQLIESPWPCQLQAQLGPAWDIVNTTWGDGGYGGQDIDYLGDFGAYPGPGNPGTIVGTWGSTGEIGTSPIATALARYNGAYTRNIFILMEVTNQLGHSNATYNAFDPPLTMGASGQTDNDIIFRMGQLSTVLKGAGSGVEVYVCTTISRGLDLPVTNPTYDQRLKAINAGFLADTTHYTDKIDVGGNPVFDTVADTSNLTYYNNDEVHVTTAGAAVIADIVLTFLLTPLPITDPALFTLTPYGAGTDATHLGVTITITLPLHATGVTILRNNVQIATDVAGVYNDSAPYTAGQTLKYTLIPTNSGFSGPPSSKFFPGGGSGGGGSNMGFSAVVEDYKPVPAQLPYTIPNQDQRSMIGFLVTSDGNIVGTMLGSGGANRTIAVVAGQTIDGRFSALTTDTTAGLMIAIGSARRI